MSKTKKIKAIALLIIFAFSIILIVTGASTNGNDNDDSSSRYQEVHLNQSFSTTTNSKNYTVEFTPNSSGYYNIYIDGARFTKMEDDNGRSTSLSYNETNAYYKYYTYDYKYREYLYSGTTYYLKTNSNNGETLTIYIAK